MLTIDELQAALPGSLKSHATQALLDELNTLTADPEDAARIQENFVTYTTVLTDGRFKMRDYLNAVAYCTFKIMGANNQEAYQKAFPTKYQNLVAQGKDRKTISAYVAMYNKGQLVNAIMEQSLIPTWLLNQDRYQEAINKQVTLIRSATSEHVQMEAANSLLTHLKRPEAAVNINIGAAETDSMQEMKRALADLAAQQRSLISQGVATREIAHQELVPIRKDSAEDAEVL